MVERVKDACYDRGSSFRLKKRFLNDLRHSLTQNRRKKYAIFLRGDAILVVYVPRRPWDFFHPGSLKQFCFPSLYKSIFERDVCVL